MGFFDKLFGIEPPKPPAPSKAKKPLIKNHRWQTAPHSESSYSLEAQGIFAEQKRLIKLALNNESESLKNIGLPVPSWKTDFKIEPSAVYQNPNELGSIRLCFPTFNIPEHLSFIVFREDFENFKEGDWLTFDELKLGIIFTIVGSNKIITQAQEDFTKHNLQYVLEKYEGLWTNREPYGLHESFNRKSWYADEKIYKDNPRNLNMWGTPLHFSKNASNDARQWKIEPLAKIPGFGTKEFLQFERRITVSLSVGEASFEYPRVGSYEIPHHPELFFVKPLPYYLFDKNYLYNFPLPEAFNTTSYITLKVLPNLKQPTKSVEYFLDNLKASTPVVFEIVKNSGVVTFLLSCSPADHDNILKQIEVSFPEFIVLPYEVPDETRDKEITAVTVEPLMNKKQLKSLREISIDPYRQLFSILSESNEYVSVQMFIHPNKEDINQAVCKSERREVNDASRFDWWLGLKIKAERESIIEKVKQNFLGQFEADKNSWKISETYLSSILDYEMPICGLVSLGTVAALVHFPDKETRLEELETVNMQSKLPPPLYTKGSTVIGVSEAHGKSIDVCLPEEVRDRHTYIVGKSGTGKTTLIESIALQDIKNGFGCAVIDPHGDMIQHIIERIPDDRIQDCVLFSPKECPISLEILAADSDHEIDLLSDDLVTMFRRTSESWGDKMQAILQMTFQTLLRVPGSSFTDISRLLTEKDYREKILSEINHPSLRSFWENRYNMREAEPILIRMDRLTTSGALRQVLTQHERSLNFYDVITEGKILLADLSKGFLGESTSHLIGSVIVSQIQLAAMRQAQLPSEQRVPFSLFVDEVQNFTTDAFSTILSEARKYKLRLTIAHQFVSQLPTDTQKAVFGNVGTMVFFGLSPDDLGAARHELGQYEPSDVANLPKYSALCRPATAARDTFSMTTLPLRARGSRLSTDEIISQTQREYERRSEFIEESIKSSPQNEILDQPADPVLKLFKRPAYRPPISFPTNTEKIMYFLQKAEYLSQPQIIALTNLQPSNASTALKKLVETKQIKTLDDRRPKIYHIGKCNPTPHNLLVRDLFVKIFNSKLAIRTVNFNKIFPGLNPDLSVEFIDKSGDSFESYFEVDRGTEGVSELVAKADRYAALAPSARVGFIFQSVLDLQLAVKTITSDQISYALIDDFRTLNDLVFICSEHDRRHPFFNG